MAELLPFDVVIEYDPAVADGYMRHFVAVPEGYAADVGDRLVGELAGVAFSRIVFEEVDGVRRMMFGEGWLADAGLAVGDDVRLALRPEPDPDHVEMPDELVAALEADPQADHLWSMLTPGRQRTLAYGVARPKRADTRQRKAAELLEALRDEIGG